MKETNRSLCYAELPKAGLGNMLLVWARAALFAQLNGLPLLISGWSKVHIGPFLRGEKDRRLYRGVFKPEYLADRLNKAIVMRTHEHVIEPEITRRLPAEAARTKNLYIFNRLPHWSDYFKDIKNYRHIVRSSLMNILADKHQQRLVRLEEPVIGIHVRCGDFRKLKPNEDFAKVGHVRTPPQYFIELIRRVREVRGEDLPVTIFSDAYDHEISELLKLPRVYRAKTNAAIVDLLLLAKSKIIIPSPGSTFGYWSAFLSDAAILHHPDHLSAAIRSEDINQEYFEGSAARLVALIPATLKRNVESITNHRKTAVGQL